MGRNSRRVVLDREVNSPVSRTGRSIENPDEVASPWLNELHLLAI